MIGAILFDLDETLILDHPISVHTLWNCAYYAASWYSLDLEALVEAAGEQATRLWKTSPVYGYTQRIGHSAGEGLWARYADTGIPEIARLHEWAKSYRVAVWRDALAEQDVADEALCEALADRFFNERRVYPRYGEVDALLEALSPHYKLGIVTNGVPDLQQDKLEGCGLLHRFQAAVISGVVDIGKPERGIFEHVCKQLDVAPEDCVMVGDNPERDVAGAINAGMRSVLVNRGFKDPDPRYWPSLEVRNLLEMLPWLDTLA